MTAEIGRVLGGRYRLVAPIGMGASAQVYLADDVKLRRRVALKMLHDALAGDAEFLRRFRAEARAAAALSHPNVMAVYDWSDGSGDGEVAFIVTEYLSGGSLRAVLDSGAQLAPSQALVVGLEAARALDYAHRRGFVHRDIKPANLLFGEEQRLRIADFGLARALAEAAWTEPQGAVLGTARYASPEQAKGESLTGKADVYSLALVMVEAVTGEVPFVADTTLGTLMARVDRPLVVPEALGPLRSVLERAGHPDPAQRIDARTLATALLRAAKALPRPEALPLVGAVAAGAAHIDDADATVHGPLGGQGEASTDLTAEDLEIEPPSWVNQSEPVVPAAAALGLGAAVAGAAALDADAPGGDASVPDDADGDAGVDADGADEPDDADAADAGVDGDGAATATEAADPDATTFAPSPVVTLFDHEADPDDHETAQALAPTGVTWGSGDHTDEVAAIVDEGEVEEGTHHRRWPWVALIVIILAALGGGAAAMATREDAPATPTSTVPLPVPDLVGLQLGPAVEIAEASGWEVEVETTRRNDTTKGEVLETTPGAGGRLDDGETITLLVSEGQELVEVPGDLAGKPYDDAVAALDAVGLKATEAEDKPYSEDVAAGDVISTAEGTPAQVERGSTVTLVVSNGPEPRTVPSGLVGSTEGAAKDALEALGLVPQIVRSFSDDVDEGQVISVLPKSGTTVERGSPVTIEVSRGPNLVEVPSISGADSISEAVSIIEGAGLVAGDVNGRASGTPQRTNPRAGEMVRPGTTVDIFLG